MPRWAKKAAHRPRSAAGSGSVSLPAPLGIGDDCAVLPAAKVRQLITTDPVIYGRHFDDATPPAAVGAKLLKRNLSDLAAMGAQPTAAVLALTLDPTRKRALAGAIYHGLAAASRRWRVRIVGGDLTQAKNFVGAHLTLLGSATGPRIVTRTGAHAGDAIYVTGELGGSRLGHHWRFTPRLAEGAWLARQSAVRAMMDVSDGLAKDLRALTPPGAKPAIDAATVPVSVRRPAPRHAHENRRCTTRSATARTTSSSSPWPRLPIVPRWRKAGTAPFRTPASRALGNSSALVKLPAGALRLERFSGYEHFR